MEELKIWFNQLCRLLSHMYEKSLTEDTELLDEKVQVFNFQSESVYESYSFNKNTENEIILKNEVTSILESMDNVPSDFKSKLIVWNFSIYLLGFIRENKENTNDHYSPVNKEFMKNFLVWLYGKKRGHLLQQIIESCDQLNKYNRDNDMNFHPLTSPININFREIQNNDAIDFTSFLKHMKKFPNAFKEFVPFWKQPTSLGKKDKDRYLTQQEEVLFKNMILQLSLDILKYNNLSILTWFEWLTPNTQNGKHVVIAISGFLSEDDDNKLAWKGLLDIYPDAPVYSYLWKSNKVANLSKPMLTYQYLVSLTLNGALKTASILSHIAGTISDYREMFANTVKKAKLAGRLLAHALMIQFPFRNQSISLVGFSLGTQVMKSCLRELDRFNFNNISKLMFCQK